MLNDKQILELVTTTRWPGRLEVHLQVAGETEVPGDASLRFLAWFYIMTSKHNDAAEFTCRTLRSHFTGMDCEVFTNTEVNQFFVMLNRLRLGTIKTMARSAPDFGEE